MRWWLVAGALNGFIAVVAGAIGAHIVGGHVVGAMPNVFEKAATYHLIHALALFATAAAAERNRLHWRLAHLSCGLFLLGILLFCFSLYLRGATGIHAVVLATPFGGACLMLGWLCLAIAAWPVGNRKPARQNQQGTGHV